MPPAESTVFIVFSWNEKHVMKFSFKTRLFSQLTLFSVNQSEQMAQGWNRKLRLVYIRL